MTAPPTVLAIGTYDPAFGRNRQVLRLLRQAGWRVEERPVPLWSSERTDDATAPRAALAGRALLAEARAAWALLRAPRPDLVVLLHPGQIDAIVLAPLARARGVPVVLDLFISLNDTVVTDRGLAPAGSVVDHLTRLLDRWSARLVDLLLADTPEDAAFLAGMTGVDAGRLHVLRVCGDPALYRPVPEIEAASRSVCFYGTFVPLQGTETIVRAAALLRDRDVRVTMIGTGQDRPATEALARRLDAPVTFVDWVDEGDLSAVMAGHELCLGVFGSGPKAARVVPNKVVGALMAARPCLTGDTPAIRSALGDAVATVAPGDHEALAEAIVGLLDHPGRRVDLARRGHTAYRERYADDAQAPALDAALRRVRGWRSRQAPPLTAMAWLRHDRIEHVLGALPPGDVLEVGCGMGAMGHRLAAGGRRYVGVEPDPTSWQAARERLRDLPGAEVRLGTDTDVVAADERFDQVCAFEVLEHIDDDGAALRRWHDLLRPGGAVVLSVPAHPERFGPTDAAVGHLRRYRADELEALLRRAGFTDVVVEPYGAGLGRVLEWGRDQLVTRRPPRASAAEGTARSGRLRQPTGHLTGGVTRIVAAPFRAVERRTGPRPGVGWVAVGRR